MTSTNIRELRRQLRSHQRLYTRAMRDRNNGRLAQQVSDAWRLIGELRSELRTMKVTAMLSWAVTIYTLAFIR